MKKTGVKRPKSTGIIVGTVAYEGRAVSTLNSGSMTLISEIRIVEITIRVIPI